MSGSPAIPPLPGGLPLLGHALAFRRNPVALLQSGRQNLGDIFRFRLFHRDVYALLSPEASAAFFRAPDEQLSQREAYRFTIPIFGRGVAYDVEPSLMAEQLRLLHPGLRDEAMQGYAALMQAEVESFARRLGEVGEIDLMEAMNELTIFIAGRCLIGQEFRARLSERFGRLYRELERGINLIAFMAPGFPSPANVRRDRARRQIAKLIAELIAERKASQRDSGANDFLTVLMQARYRNQDRLSDDVITGMIITLLFAGQHTSAVMASWAGMLMICHPDTLAAVRHEAESLLGDHPVQLAAIKRMHLLEACLKEAERLYPPLVVLMRTVQQDLMIGALRVPAGALAMISPAVSHRLPEVFAAPDDFDPARYAPPREEDRAHPHALMGFGGGRHRCIGTSFAHQQIKVIWGLLLQNYDFALADPSRPPQPDYSTFVVGPRPGCRVRYRRRMHQTMRRAATLAEPVG